MRPAIQNFTSKMALSSTTLLQVKFWKISFHLPVAVLPLNVTGISKDVMFAVRVAGISITDLLTFSGKTKFEMVRAARKKNSDCCGTMVRYRGTIIERKFGGRGERGGWRGSCGWLSKASPKFSMKSSRGFNWSTELVTSRRLILGLNLNGYNAHASSFIKIVCSDEWIPAWNECTFVWHSLAIAGTIATPPNIWHNELRPMITLVKLPLFSAVLFMLQCHSHRRARSS